MNIPHYRRVAPFGTKDKPHRWLGRSSKKPWDYKVSAAICHLDTIEPLSVVIHTLRCQSERPYIMILDTGSPPEVCDQLEKLRAEDVEIHYQRGHAYVQSSAAVAAAQDVAMALCRSEFLYSTHTDVFARRRDLLEWLLTLCNGENPVVGYQMSERSWATDLWQHCVGHQCLMLHMPTVRKIGLSWNMEQGYDLAGWSRAAGNANGWPDTETGFGLDMLRKGIKPYFIGQEINHVRQVDENIDHARTYTGRRVFLDANKQWLEAGESMMAEAMTEARQRVARWQRGLP